MRIFVIRKAPFICWEPLSCYFSLKFKCFAVFVPIHIKMRGFFLSGMKSYCLNLKNWSPKTWKSKSSKIDCFNSKPKWSRLFKGDESYSFVPGDFWTTITFSQHNPERDQNFNFPNINFRTTSPRAWFQLTLPKYFYGQYTVSLRPLAF